MLQRTQKLPPIILITAFGDAEVHQQASELGVAAILDKPFEVAELLAKVREVLAHPEHFAHKRECSG
jgi:DNA-binding response OmpR family regulator